MDGDEQHRQSGRALAAHGGVDRHGNDHMGRFGGELQHRLEV